MLRQVRRALVGSSVTLVAVIVGATAVTALDPLDDQLSATPLPILSTATSAVPTTPNYNVDSDPNAPTTTPPGGLPNVGTGQSADDDEEEPPETDASPADSGEDDESSTSGPLPTYGGTMYSKRPSSSAAPKSGSGAGSVGSLDTDGSMLGSGSGTGDEGEGADGTNSSAGANGAPATVGAVPGLELGLTVLGLAGLTFFVSRRMRA